MLGTTNEILPHYVNFCQRLSGAQQIDNTHPKTPRFNSLNTSDNLLTSSPSNDLEIASSTAITAPHPSIGGGLLHDFRQDLVSYQILEMSYKPSQFSGGNSSSHNDGRCAITEVRFEDRDGRPLSLVKGGCACRLTVRAHVYVPIISPLIGFAVLDRRGQVLFGENTFGNGAYQEMVVNVGEDIEAAFLIEWPWLAAGEYAITAAIGSGGKIDHVNHSWVNESVILTSTPGTRLVNGLFSPPILDITLNQIKRSPADEWESMDKPQVDA
jgi:lipopolysaccharide transport system ATP-binding protein